MQSMDPALRMLIVGAVGTAFACAPCAGTSACTTTPRFVLLGSTVLPPNGRPLPGVELHVRLVRDGQEIARQRVTSDADGLWEFRAEAGAADAVALVWLKSSPTDSFAIPPFRVRPSSRAGDAMILPPWFVRPFTNHLRSILLDGEPLVHATVRFTPTGGVARPDAQPWTGRTNGVGAFELPFEGTAVGDAIGVLAIEHPLLPGTTVVFNDYRVEVGHVFSIPIVLGTFVFTTQ